MNMVSSAAGMRIMPAMPAGAYKTYQIVAPLATHFRNATCEEAQCADYLYGFRSVIDESTELGQQQAYYVRRESGRRYVEVKQPDGLTEFTFEPGQKCFKGSHKVRLERDETFIVRGGDWRGNPSRTVFRHRDAGQWTEDFAEHQDHINRLIERG